MMSFEPLPVAGGTFGISDLLSQLQELRRGTRSNGVPRATGASRMTRPSAPGSFEPEHREPSIVLGLDPFALFFEKTVTLGLEDPLPFVGWWLIAWRAGKCSICRGLAISPRCSVSRRIGPLQTVR